MSFSETCAHWANMTAFKEIVDAMINMTFWQWVSDSLGKHILGGLHRPPPAWSVIPWLLYDTREKSSDWLSTSQIDYQVTHWCLETNLGGDLPGYYPVSHQEYIQTYPVNITEAHYDTSWNSLWIYVWLWCEDFGFHFYFTLITQSISVKVIWPRWRHILVFA